MAVRATPVGEVGLAIRVAGEANGASSIGSVAVTAMAMLAVMVLRLRVQTGQ
jgi:hypothetical protein